MARRGVREKQFTLYFRSPDQKKQMRKLAKSHRLTLSNYILVTLEKSLEEVPTLAEQSDKFADLRNDYQKMFEKALQLDQENKILTARLRAKDTVSRNLDPRIINLFRYNTDVVTLAKIQDAAGLSGQRLDPKVRQDLLKSVDFTLAQLEASGLIRKTWDGWQWNL